VQLLVVRHARPHRADGEDATADPELTALGHKQAAATADFLAGEGIDHVVASPLRRAQQTAAPLAARLSCPIETVEGLREIDPFGGAYVPAEEMTMEHQVVQDLSGDPLRLFGSAGGFEQFRSVVVAAFDEIVARNRGRTVAVFCHGTVIGTYLSALFGTDDPFTLLPDYCGLYRIAASSTGLRTVRSANETGHVRDLLG
jgi:2,3-bisphosphoglycerate-dependent phosphoglycerate mutase